MRAVGLDAAEAVPLRLTENETRWLPDGVVVRIARAEQWQTVMWEGQVARRLADSRIRAVEPVPGVEQPVGAEGRPVTSRILLNNLKIRSPQRLELHGYRSASARSLECSHRC